VIASPRLRPIALISTARLHLHHLVPSLLTISSGVVVSGRYHTRYQKKGETRRLGEDKNTRKLLTAYIIYKHRKIASSRLSLSSRTYTLHTEPPALREDSTHSCLPQMLEPSPSERLARNVSCDYNKKQFQFSLSLRVLNVNAIFRLRRLLVLRGRCGAC
jgi:hypothetical protein